MLESIHIPIEDTKRKQIIPHIMKFQLPCIMILSLNSCHYMHVMADVLRIYQKKYVLNNCEHFQLLKPLIYNDSLYEY